MREGETHFEEVPAETQEQSEKEIAWVKAEQDAEQIPHIEKATVKIVSALNLLEIPTSQSCEGHIYENKTGINLPFVEISVHGQPEERFVGQEKIIPKVSKKYGMPEDDARTMILHSMPYEEFYSLEETEAYKKWRKEGEKMVENAEKLLKDFYQDSATPEHIRLIIREQDAGQFEITNNGRDQDSPPASEETNFTQEQKAELQERLSQYQKEMDGFAEFLKQKYLGN
jgi:hypothetical protein